MVSLKDWHDALKNHKDTQLLTWIEEGDFKYCPIDIVVRASTTIKGALLFSADFLAWYECQAKNRIHEWMQWAVMYLDLQKQWDIFCEDPDRYTVLLRHYDPNSCYIFHHLPEDALTWCAYQRVDLLPHILPEHFDRVRAHPLELMGHVAGLSTLLYEKAIVYLWEYYFNTYKPTHGFENTDRHWLQQLPLDCYYYAVYCDQDGMDDVMHEILSYHKTPAFVEWLLTSKALKKRNQLSMFMDYVDLYRQTFKPLIIDFYRTHLDEMPTSEMHIQSTKGSHPRYHWNNQSLLGEAWLTAYLDMKQYTMTAFQDAVHAETYIMKELEACKRIAITDVLRRVEARRAEKNPQDEGEIYL